MKLLCDTNPMCYGSSATLLAILDHIEADTTVLTEGVTSEILSGDSNVDRTVATQLKNPEEVFRKIGHEDFDAVLVVNNQSNIEAYVDRGWPVFYVDILFWYGREKASKPVWRLATRAFVQSFPGVLERTSTMSASERPQIVGPIVRRPPVRERRGTLVNIGGARSRFVLPGRNSHYTALVCSSIEALSGLLPCGPVDIAAGREAVESMVGWAPPPGFRIGTFDNITYLQRLGSAALCVTAPGLNAVFEGLYSGADMVFLPPQNASQVLQLAAYEKAGIVAPGLNLDALVGDFTVPDDVTEEGELTLAVLGALERLGKGRAVVEHLRTQLSEQETRRAAREAFMRSLGEPGGSSIGRAIMDWYVAP